MNPLMIEKRNKYLNNDSFYFGSYCYLTNIPDNTGSFFVKDFNDKTIFIIPSVSDDVLQSRIVCRYIFDCFDAKYEFSCCDDDYFRRNTETSLVSRYFNRGIDNHGICFITCEDYDQV